MWLRYVIDSYREFFTIILTVYLAFGFVVCAIIAFFACLHRVVDGVPIELYSLLCVRLPEPATLVVQACVTIASLSLYHTIPLAALISQPVNEPIVDALFARTWLGRVPDLILFTKHGFAALIPTDAHRIEYLAVGVILTLRTNFVLLEL